MTTYRTSAWFALPLLLTLSSCSEMTELSFYLSKQAPVQEFAQQSRAEWRVTIWQDPRLMDSELEQAWPDTTEANKLFDAMMRSSKGHMGRLQSTSWIKTSKKSISIRLDKDTTIYYEPEFNDIVFYHQMKMYQRAATSADKALFDYLDSQIYSQEFARYSQEFAQLLKASQSGDTDAMLKLSAYYLRGFGTDINQQKAYQYLQQAADAGNHDAIAKLACTYYYYTFAKEYNLEQDRAKSYAYAQKLAEEGYKMSSWSLIRSIYEEGKKAEATP